MPTLTEAGWSSLHDAALRGDAAALVQALEGGLDVSAATTLGVLGSSLAVSQLVRPKGQTVYPATLARVEGPAALAFDAGTTALSVAAWAARRDIVELLLARGARPDAKDGVGATALHHAARAGALDVVELLLAKKAKPDVATKKAKSAAFFDAGMTPLLAALGEGHLDVARRLIASGADPKATTTNGNTALFFVARAGDVGALSLLREAGVSLIAGRTYLNDPLLEATARGHLTMVRALVEAGSAADATHLREATVKGHDALRAYLLSAGVPPLVHRTPMDAARANDPWALEAMHASGVDVGAPAVLTEAVGVGAARVVDLLLARGARLATDPGTIGPLHMAIENHHADLALRLIEAGAPLDAKDGHGNTPLFVASMRRGMVPVLEAMIARGANPHEVMRHGNSAWKVTETTPSYRAVLEKTAHVPDPTAKGWEPPTASRVLTDASLRPTFKQTYQALFDELVPPRGAAPSLQGELVRVSHKLWDEATRNGNGNFDERHRAMAEVLDVVCGPPFEGPRLTQIRAAVRAVAKGTLDDDLHRRVAHAVLEWCVANPALVPRGAPE
ncbi:MAG: ankyrin repeat domain-containing protein [Sandaracinus sp.]